MERVDRNYDRESQDALGHKYAYTFDLDVMHPFMLRSFEPFFNAGSVLELGKLPRRLHEAAGGAFHRHHVR